MPSNPATLKAAAATAAPENRPMKGLEILITLFRSGAISRDPNAGGLGPVPEHPVVKVFDLQTHEFMRVHADNMEPHKYEAGSSSCAP